MGDPIKVLAICIGFWILGCVCQCLNFVATGAACGVTASATKSANDTGGCSALFMLCGSCVQCIICIACLFFTFQAISEA